MDIHFQFSSILFPDAEVFYSSKSTSQSLLHNAKFDNNSNTLHAIYSFCNLYLKILYLFFLTLLCYKCCCTDFSLTGTIGVILLLPTIFSVELNGMT